MTELKYGKLALRLRQLCQAFLFVLLKYWISASMHFVVTAPLRGYSQDWESLGQRLPLISTPETRVQMILEC